MLQEYFTYRSRVIAQQKAEGDNPYPHKFHVELSLPEFIDRYGGIDAGTITEKDVSVSGNGDHSNIRTIYLSSHRGLLIKERIISSWRESKFIP